MWVQTVPEVLAQVSPHQYSASTPAVELAFPSRGASHCIQNLVAWLVRPSSWRCKVTRLHRLHGRFDFDRRAQGSWYGKIKLQVGRISGSARLRGNAVLDCGPRCIGMELIFNIDSHL